MKTKTEIPPAPSLAATVAGEDLQPGDHVAILNETIELPSYLWSCDAGLLAPHEVVRLVCMSREGGLPLLVKAVCLPFVLLKDPDGTIRSIDIRRVQLVRLNPEYAQLARSSLRNKTSTIAKD